jgi:hypothetical protein
MDAVVQNNHFNTEQKVEIVFNYLFDNNKANEEEFFWNQLSSSEISKLNKIKKEE